MIYSYIKLFKPLTYCYKNQIYRSIEKDQKTGQICFISHWPHYDIGSLIGFTQK